MPKKDINITYMNIAYEIADLSYSRRKCVGCIIVKNNSIIATGYNGMPYGFDNNCEIENEDGSLVTKEETLHAESNAISKVAKSTFSTENSDMYITMSPCKECSKLIIQSGIKNVYYSETYRNTSGLDLLEKAGIKTIKIDGTN
jgi:dCMP deaminase